MHFSNCETLDDAKSLFKKLCFQLHPDQSGADTSKEFAAMRAEFESFRPGAENEKYDGEFEQWDGVKFSELIVQLMAIDGIEIEITGSFVWIGGDTKPVKEQIKAIDGGDLMNSARFSRKKKLWYFSPKGYRRYSRKSYSMDEIRQNYGSKTVGPGRNNSNRLSYSA